MDQPQNSNPPAVLSFTRADDVFSRSVLKINGVETAILTHMALVSPANVTEAQINRHVEQAARQANPTDPDSHWEVDLPGIGRVEEQRYDDLALEIASNLNNAGVNVSDWPAFNLRPEQFGP
jgi:hypothetical protein